jgi:hypothetical protein
MLHALLRLGRPALSSRTSCSGAVARTCQRGRVGMSRLKPAGVKPTSAGSSTGMYVTPLPALPQLLLLHGAASAAAGGALPSAAAPCMEKGAGGTATSGLYRRGAVTSSTGACVSCGRCACCCELAAVCPRAVCAPAPAPSSLSSCAAAAAFLWARFSFRYAFFAEPLKPPLLRFHAGPASSAAAAAAPLAAAAVLSRGGCLFCGMCVSRAGALRARHRPPARPTLLWAVVSCGVDTG